MPGTILDVLVNKDQLVKKGETLIVTEAMKMETILKAPFDGKIQKIYVEKDSAIRTGDLLLEIKPV